MKLRLLAPSAEIAEVAKPAPDGGPSMIKVPGNVQPAFMYVQADSKKFSTFD